MKSKLFLSNLALLTIITSCTQFNFDDITRVIECTEQCNECHNEDAEDSKTTTPDSIITIDNLVQEVILFDEDNLKDTYIRNEGLYRNDNFGLQEYMMIGSRIAQGGGNRRMLFQFDTDLIPDTFDSVYFELYKYGYDIADGSVVVDVFPIIESGDRTPWLEGNGVYGQTCFDESLCAICWGDNGYYKEFEQPMIDISKSYGTQILGTANGSYQINITELVKEWKSGERKNFGFMVVSQNEGAPYNNVSLLIGSSSNKNIDYRPKLVISK